MTERYFEAPNNAIPTGRSVFLGGGITGCPDWQKPVTERLLAETTLTIYNPRRANWNFADLMAEDRIQITWERTHLLYSDYHLYWFPAESICPIALFELGKSLGQKKKIFVGAHPDYPRMRDIQIQCECEGYSYIADDPDILVNAIIAHEGKYAV